ncbi:MAG: hypothetical protein NC830_07355, partial [Candidatus Omnitrophica bacterium]|nr:hypothetical protein [Candidatus Omnitrophota bacterium]
QLSYQSGYHLVLIDIIESVIETLNSLNQYPLWLVGEKVEKLAIRNVSGIKITDRQAIVEASRNTDLISFSVGVNNMKGLVQVFKEIIENKSIFNPSSQLN